LAFVAEAKATEDSHLWSLQTVGDMFIAALVVCQSIALHFNDITS